MLDLFVCLVLSLSRYLLFQQKVEVMIMAQKEEEEAFIGHVYEAKLLSLHIPNLFEVRDGFRVQRPWSR